VVVQDADTKRVVKKARILLYEYKIILVFWKRTPILKIVFGIDLFDKNLLLKGNNTKYLHVFS
jgi:hypothetical protein